MDTKAILEQLDGATKIKLGAFDIDGVLRAKYVSPSKFRSALEKGLGFCDVVFGWDMADALYDNVTYTGWHTGYPDAHAKIETGTLRRIPWEGETPFFLLDFYDRDDSPLFVSPRQALRKVIARAQSMGYQVKAGFEFEFFIFQESHHTLNEAEHRDLVPLSYGMFGYSATRTSRDQGLVHQIFDELAEFGCGLEGFHTETGPGVYEAALSADAALASADKAALFKQSLKEIATQHGCTATFMAKPNVKMPGCSGHIHQSLGDASGKNLFAGSPGELSELAQRYVAGQVKYMPEVTALFAPTVNSYKRFVPGTWAPVRATWGLENRTCALRAITGPGEGAVRVEYRAAGADQNPYLGLAAGIMTGLAGVSEGLTPPDPVRGNSYDLTDADGDPLPTNLGHAAEALAKSAVARDWLGEGFVDHFVNTRRWEWREFERAVTDWETQRYLEVI